MPLLLLAAGLLLGAGVLSRSRCGREGGGGAGDDRPLDRAAARA